MGSTPIKSSAKWNAKVGGQNYGGTSPAEMARRNAAYALSSVEGQGLDARVTAALVSYGLPNVGTYMAAAREFNKIIKKRSGPMLIAELTAIANKWADAMGLDLTILYAMILSVFGINIGPPPPPPTFDLEILTTVPGESFSFPLVNDGGTYTFTIDWGDGSPISTITAWNDPGLLHVYAAPGTYTVSLDGICTRLDWSTYTAPQQITGLLDCTDMGMGFLCFNGCNNLSYVTPNMNRLTSLTGALSMFKNCVSLVSVPAGIFSGSPGILRFGDTFAGCTLLASIPAGIFDSAVLAWDFESVFQNCVGLTSIPSGLFDKNVIARSFISAFQGCTGLTSIPVGLFAQNVVALQMNAIFYNCTGLTAIPLGIFDTNVLANSFRYTFNGCTGIVQDIPGDIFLNCLPVDSFNSTFKNCSGMTGGGWATIIANSALPGHAVPSDTNDCFLGAINLTNYALIPAAWK